VSHGLPRFTRTKNTSLRVSTVKGVTAVDPRGDYVWLQIARILRERIESGQYPPEQILPSARYLADELGVSKGSVTHAMNMLHRWGMTEGRVGRGTLVTPRSQWHPDD
jgi:DNA-binding GntR family transcriptional regulator